MCPESLTLKRGHTGAYEEVGRLGGESGEPDSTAIGLSSCRQDFGLYCQVFWIL